MSANQQLRLTPDGKLEHEEELRKLVSVTHPELLARVQELSEAGDVSDDSDFENTKEELVRVEARIREIKNILSDAVIVEHEDSGGVVEFGSTVKVVDEFGDVNTWTIVSGLEARASLGKISIESPMGAALIGKSVGDKFTVDAPGGELVFEVLEID